MKKKILCFILAVLMLTVSLPVSAIAAEIAQAIKKITMPDVKVSSLYSYSESDPREFRALPDMEGVFTLKIFLEESKKPKDGSEILVYYRTVDDSAVAKWGDYESVGIEPSVILNSANNYTAIVNIESRILADGFYTSDENGEPNENKLVTRRFIFELTHIEAKAERHELNATERAQSALYCYLRAKLYHYQTQSAQMITDKWKSAVELEFERYRKEFLENNIGDYSGDPNDPKYLESLRIINMYLDLVWYSVITGDYRLYGVETPEDININIPEMYKSLYYTVEGASALNTPHIEIKGNHKENINLSFNEEWKSYVQSGWCDLGISIKGDLMREYWDSDGPATFNLYYNHGGEKKLALTLYLQGEFDDSTHFGWEHAFEYAVEGLEGDNRDDHMDENFIGFTVYENGTTIEKGYNVDINGEIVDKNGAKVGGSTLQNKEAYKVKINSRSEMDEIEVCGQLKRTIIGGNAVEMLSGFKEDFDRAGNEDKKATSYYLRLPSDFALADSYSYEFITESTRTGSKIEIRWLENVEIAFTLIGNRAPMILRDDVGKQMVSTNVETLKVGDHLRMSVRFDRPVHIADPSGNCYVTADIYNGKNTRIAKGVVLKLKQLDGITKSGDYYHYAWDTLVFEGDLPPEVDNTNIAYIRNIRFVDGKEAETDPTEGIRSFFTELELLSMSIEDIRCSRDLRTPEANAEINSSGWSRSKSVDVYVNVKGSPNTRFNDYVTVYYQWSNIESNNYTGPYGSKMVFHTNEDGEILKTIIGTGNGRTFLYMKAVSGYGKSSETRIGPFDFDNAPPVMAKGYEEVTVDNANDQTIRVLVPADNCGVKTMELYYIPYDSETGEAVRLKGFDISKGQTEFTHKIRNEDVNVGIDSDSERQEIDFYWRVTDNLGNVNEKTGEFTLAFDTNDYLDADIEKIIAAHSTIEQYVETIDEYNCIYNIGLNGGISFKLGDETLYYLFGFKIREDAFGDVDNGIYTAKVSYKGTPLTEKRDFDIEKNSSYSSYGIVKFLTPMKAGRYDIQIVRTENDKARVSHIYSIYVTNGENDATEIKNKVKEGTLLSNKVYQLSGDYSYFYYKNTEGAIQKEYYNGTKQPPTFSNYSKAKQYAYYKELSDIYLVKLNEGTASALISGTTGYRMASGETVIPKAGQFWIRYKSATWTPTAGDSAWVYYYYGTNNELSEGALSMNLGAALNAVANRIVSNGKTVILTDTSLFLGTAMGDKLLDEHGMPYLSSGQIHCEDELSYKTMCENAWKDPVGFAADKNIYNSIVHVGVEEIEYPLVGNFELPQDSIFQYMTYDQYASGILIWQSLKVEKGGSFISSLSAPGGYYIREISKDGVSIFSIYIDKYAPNVTFTNADGNRIPIDGVNILDINTKELYIGNIDDEDCLSYVAIYKVSNLSRVGVYTVDDLAYTSIKLDDGNYYIIVSDRSGNCYTVTAKVSSTTLECNIRESTDRFIRLTCNRRSDQIYRYEVYLNGVLLTSTYAEEQTFTKAGLYTVYIQDIYGNEYSYINEDGEEGYLFVRNYPKVTWKYYVTDGKNGGKYHTYNPEIENPSGFILDEVSDNQYKISTAVKTRFSFSGDYAYEFIGVVPEYDETLGSETTVTIEAGQSFTLKVYYKSHKDCYVIYSGIVDVTPPSISVSADIDVLRNGEYSLFETWASGKVGDVIAMKDLYYILSEVTTRNVSNGGNISSDIIKINSNDVNGLSLVEVYLNGALINKQDTNSGFSQITVNRAGVYRIVARDRLGNVSEFTFTNGISENFDYFVDGAEKEIDLHGYLNFEIVNNKYVYTKIDFGNKDFKLDLKRNADVFMSVGVTGGATEIYGFRISDGQIYPLNYKIAIDKNNNKSIELAVGEAILDMSAEDFKLNKEYLISKTGAYAIYVSVGADKVISIKVYAPEDSSKVVSVGARIEVVGSNTTFVSAELSKKTSSVSFKDSGVQTDTDIRMNDGFIIDESAFESERIESIRIYYSKLNDLDASKLAGKTNIYIADREYDDEGFYLLIVRNHYGNEKIYKIAISRSFGITSSVVFSDGHKIYYSMNYDEALYSNAEIILDILDEDVTVWATVNGVAYTDFVQKKDGDITYIVFSEPGKYEVTFTDSYGNKITRQLEINKSSYTVAENLLTGYNEKALKRNEGYTNQKLSVDKSVYDSSGIYYLAVQYGETLNVLYDAFAERPVVADAESFINVIGSDGDGVYKVICRNRYGAVVTKDIHYRGTPTLKLERTIRSKSEPEIYDLNYALSLGFWSNNTMSFSTDAKTYVFTINGSATECPRTLVFENAGDFGNFEYVITYIDEYGFEYSFKAYLVRKNVTVDIPSSIEGTEIDGVLSTKNNISITFEDSAYATYTRNNGEEVFYHSGDVLKKDGTYRFTVIDYAGNATTMTIKKDTAVEFSFVDSVSGNVIQNGSVVNSTKIGFKVLNKDSAYIEKVVHNGVVQSDFTGSKFTEDGKWELIVCDELGNRSYFCFYVITRAQNGFAYTTPHEYRITEMWYDSGDGVKVSYMAFVNHTDFTSSFDFTENGKYIVVMSSDVTGITSTFEFTVNTTAPDVSLVGCDNGETTINDVSITGYKVGDRIKIYRATKTGEELVSEVEITSLATKIPTITEGGKYRIVVESEAGVQTELSFVRKHVMNTAGSVFIMIIIGLSVVGLFAGLVYRNKSKTDD